MIDLRPYQTEAVDSVFAYFGKRAGNPLVVLPTGSGKSLVLASFIKRAIESYEGTRVLVLTHRAELIDQDASAIRRLWPQADVGIYSAGMGRRQIRPVTVAGVQSFAHVKTMPHFDLVVIDECHLVPHAGEGQYRTVLTALSEKNTALKVIGLTATPFRLSGGRLTRGDGKIFTSICYELPVQRLVDEGYLSPLITPEFAAAQSYSTTSVATRGGDFAPGELANVVEQQGDITERALSETARLAADRKSWLIYCVSVEHARQAAQRLFSLGISASVVTGEDESGSRRSKIDAFKRGDTRALVSVDVLTTGFDAPRVDCIAILRPTQSTALYVQICGRGMRLSPETGKVDCLVLDFGSNISRHGPITALNMKELPGAVAKKFKICPKCDAEVPKHRIECAECGHIFDRMERAVDHESRAARSAIMGPAPEPTWTPVTAMDLSMHLKRDAQPDANGQLPPATVCVRYFTGNLARRDYREWVCPEHGGYAAYKFAKWWHERGGLAPPPQTVDETISRRDELRPIDGVMIVKDRARRRDGTYAEYDRVARVRFAPMREPGSDDDVEADPLAGVEDSAVNAFAGDVDLPF